MDPEAERAPRRPEGRLQAGLGIVSAALLVVLAYQVLRPFVIPMAWAAILAYATWPLHRVVRRLLGGRALPAALVTTTLVVLAVALPVGLLSLALAGEVGEVFRTLRAWGERPPDLPAWVAGVPLVGAPLTGWYALLRTHPGTLERLLVEHAAGWSQPLLGVAGDLGRNLARVGLTLLTLFFFCRHGDVLVGQTQRVIAHLAGRAVERRLLLVGTTVRAVFYGVLLTAGSQGLLAGLGFWAVGLRGAVLLGALTALLALLPFGPPLVWLPASVWLLASGEGWRGVALLVWGAIAVSGVDNVLRPYFIGGATQIPFLLVLFGVLGGIAAFGALGVFVGPVVLAVLLALWRDWVAAAGPGPDGAAPPDLPA